MIIERSTCNDNRTLLDMKSRASIQFYLHFVLGQCTFDAYFGDVAL